MKAVQIHSRGGTEKLVYEETAEQPRPKDVEVLVRGYATSVTPTELTWSTNWENKDGSSRTFPAIPGHDFSGIAAEIGSDVSDVTVGTAVYGLTDFRGNGERGGIYDCTSSRDRSQTSFP
jgi:NADPH:quinone reductase-like Zn-dependent oxidoreductase